MRPWLLAPVVVLCVLPPASLAQTTGGATAPTGSGGVEYGTPGAAPKKPKKKSAKAKRVAPLTATEFTINPGTIQPGGAPVTFGYRLDGSARRARVRVEIVPASGASTAVLRLHLGWKPTAQRRTYSWSLPEGTLPVGDYQARLHAVDDAGHRLVRSATASGRSPVHVVAAPVPVTVGSGVFPLQGAFDWGDKEARFGAQRNGHVHQGQDLMAAEGTPIVSPRAGFVYFKAYQSGGAGHYLVVRGDDGRDYVFMHLKSGSATVGRDDPVTAGQVIGQVGDTGDAEGFHLHFEIWPTGWYAKDSQPIDPLPDLQAWASAAGLPGP
jgi:murein DD-endopeptidase MepM/ murein hydrolase activator NlpD